MPSRRVRPARSSPCPQGRRRPRRRAGPRTARRATSAAPADEARAPGGDRDGDERAKRVPVREAAGERHREHGAYPRHEQGEPEMADSTPTWDAIHGRRAAKLPVTQPWTAKTAAVARRARRTSGAGGAAATLRPYPAACMPSIRLRRVLGEGDEAPDFTLRSDAGDEVTLSSLAASRSSSTSIRRTTRPDARRRRAGSATRTATSSAPARSCSASPRTTSVRT